MRWDELFADLEAELDREHAAELQAEVTDRSRRELARIALLDRARAHVGAAVAVAVVGAGAVRGTLWDATAEWLMIEESSGREALVPLTACLWVQGLGRRADVPSAHSLARRLGLGAALRSLARQRVSVQLVLVDGGALTGTIDRVHADHLDLAEHPGDEMRRREAVSGVRAVPFWALSVVRPS